MKRSKPQHRCARIIGQPRVLQLSEEARQKQEQQRQQQEAEKARNIITGSKGKPNRVAHLQIELLKAEAQEQSSDWCGKFDD
jgi:hypothetical protein